MLCDKDFFKNLLHTVQAMIEIENSDTCCSFFCSFEEFHIYIYYSQNFFFSVMIVISSLFFFSLPCTVLFDVFVKGKKKDEGEYDSSCM